MELFPNSDSPIWKSMDINSNKKDNTKSIDKEYTNNEDGLDSKSEKIKTELGKETNIKDAASEKTNPEEVSVLEENNDNISILKEKKTLPLDKDNKNQLDIIEKNTVYYIQLASLSEENLVVKEWKRLKRIYNPQLNNLTYITEKVNLKNNKVYFRLLVGAFNKEKDAKDFCNNIGLIETCILKNY